jgi:hypothetical protein
VTQKRIAADGIPYLSKEWDIVRTWEVAVVFYFGSGGKLL